LINPFVKRGGRLRNGWWIALFFLVLAALLLPLLLLGRESGEPPPIWQQALVVIAASVICQALRRRPLSELTGRVSAATARDVFVGFGLGAALMLAPALLLAAIGAVRFAVSPNGALGVINVALVMAAVAVTEEFLFRGFLFQRLIDGLGPWPAQVLIAALFTLTHSDALAGAGALGYLAGANIFLASLAFGFAFIRTGGLAMPIAIHFAANVVQGGVLGFGVSGNDEHGWLAPTLTGPDWLTGGAFGLEASAPGVICVAALAFGLYRWRASSPKQ